MAEEIIKYIETQAHQGNLNQESKDFMNQVKDVVTGQSKRISKTNQELTLLTRERDEYKNQMNTLDQRIATERQDAYTEGRRVILEENFQKNQELTRGERAIDSADRVRQRFPVGKPEKFKLGESNFKNFLVSYEIFAKAADIPKEKQVECMMCLLDSPAQRRVESLGLTASDMLDPDKCYDKMRRVLTEVNSKAEAKRKLFKMKQGENETVTDFATKLLDMADYAYMDEQPPAKNQILLDIFMQGLLLDEIAFDIAKENPENFEDAYSKAMELEGIYMSRKCTKSTRFDDEILIIEDQATSSQDQRGGTQPWPCRICGMDGHDLRFCPVIECYKCHGRGHIARDCTSRGQPSRSQSNARSRSWQGQTRQHYNTSRFNGQPRNDNMQRPASSQNNTRFPAASHPSRRSDWFDTNNQTNGYPIRREWVRQGQNPSTAEVIGPLNQDQSINYRRMTSSPLNVQQSSSNGTQNFC